MKLLTIVMSLFLFAGCIWLNSDETENGETENGETENGETENGETENGETEVNESEVLTAFPIVTSFTCASEVSLEIRGTDDTDGTICRTLVDQTCCGLYQIHEDGSRELLSSNATKSQCNALESALISGNSLTSSLIPNEEHRTIHGTGCTRN